MKLAAWRKARNIRQTELGLAIGVSQSRIARYETGTSIPSAPVMVRIRELTGGRVTANDFYDEIESAAQ